MVGYHRKSSGVKADLDTGIGEIRAFIKENYGLEGAKVYSDLASHVNFDGRKQFTALLDSVFEGKIKRIVILYKDRVSRLPIHQLLEKIVGKFGVQIVYVNNLHDDNPDSVREAMNDLLSFSHTVSCRIYAKRSADKRKLSVSEETRKLIEKRVSQGAPNTVIYRELKAKGLTCENKKGEVKPINLTWVHRLVQQFNRVAKVSGNGRVGDFMKEKVRSVEGATTSIRKKALYAAYVDWAEKQGVPPLTAYAFSKALTKQGITTTHVGKRTNGRRDFWQAWAGLALR